MVLFYVGFHGTDNASAANILSSGQFRPSQDDEDWLGTGIYFFEDDCQAKAWCVKVRKYAVWTVLVSRLESENVIDLTRTDHYQEFIRIANAIKMRYLKRADGNPRKLLNGAVLNIMYNVKPYDMVRGSFESHLRPYKDRINVLPVQIQICVRNQSCIKSIEEAFGGAYSA